MKAVIQLVVLVLMLVSQGGCGKKTTDPAFVDTTQLERVFSTASEEDRAILNHAVGKLRERDPVGALKELEKLNDRSDLTPEQQISLKTTLVRVQDAILCLEAQPEGTTAAP